MFKLRLFGTPHLQGPSGDLPAPGPRRVALIASLAAAGPAGLTRDKLIARLSPDTNEDRARRNLSQALYSMRTELGAGSRPVLIYSLHHHTLPTPQETETRRLVDNLRADAGALPAPVLDWKYWVTRAPRTFWRKSRFSLPTNAKAACRARSVSPSASEIRQTATYAVW